MKRIAGIKEIKEGCLNVVRAGSREFLVTRSGEEVTACGNICPHRGGRLCDGGLHNGVVTCPDHHARFDLSTGKAISPPAFDSLTMYETAVDGGEVFVGRPKSAGVFPSSHRDSPCFLIIGSGAAGIACAESLRMLGFDGKIVVLSRESAVPYDRTVLTTTFYTAGEEGLLLRDPEYFKFTGVDLHLHEEVMSVDTGLKSVRCASGSTFAYDKLLLATGASARRLGVEGEILSGVHHLRSLLDARTLKSTFERAGSLLVIGAGFLGLEIAFTASACGIDVTVAAPEMLPLEASFGTGYAHRVVRMLKAAGISWLPRRQVRGFSGSTGLDAVMFDDGSRIETDAAVVAIGAAPYIRYSGVDHLGGNGGIGVNRRFQTDDPDIFAAGDVCESHAGHWVTAMRQGRAAAAAMMGLEGEAGGEAGADGRAALRGDVPFFWTDLGSETLRMVGRRAGPDGLVHVEHGDITSGDFLAVTKEANDVTGAFSVGFDKELIGIEQALRETVE